MVLRAVTVTATAVLLFAVSYQSYFREIIVDLLGFGRIVQPIEDFPYACRRIRHEYLEGCEDAWLDHEGRAVYLACTGTTARKEWGPGVGRYNVSGRRRGGAVISVLDADKPGDDGLFDLRQLKAMGYQGATGDGSLDTVGFDIEVLDEHTLRLRLVNIGPPVDGNQQYLDASKYGGNATIEVFHMERGSNEMHHIRTILSDAIQTPNKPAATDDGGFLVTNDMSGKLGLRKEFDLFLGGGSLAYCSAAGKCHLATEKGLAYPNGMVRGHDGLFYVPNSFSNTIKVMELLPDLTLKESGTIPIGMPIDNLHVDANGDIWAAGMPKALRTFASFADPFTVDAPSTIWRIRKRGDGLGYVVEKMLEDKEASFLGTATVAVHDVKTGRLFIGGAMSPYITVCDRLGG